MSSSPTVAFAPVSAAPSDERLSADQKGALSYFSGAVAAGEASLAGDQVSSRSASDAAEGAEAADGSGGEGTSQRGEVSSDSRKRMIAIAIVAIVAAVAIVAFIIVSTSHTGEEEVLEVVGGAEDETTTEEESDSATRQVTTTNGNPVEVVISVAEGETSLITVTYDDDSDYNGTAVGPWEREFLVTESLEASVGNPEAVTITEDGEEVEIEVGDDGEGTFSLEVNNVSSADEAASDEESSDKSSSGKKKGSSSKKSSSKKSSSGDSDSSDE